MILPIAVDSRTLGPEAAVLNAAPLSPYLLRPMVVS